MRIRIAFLSNRFKCKIHYNVLINYDDLSRFHIERNVFIGANSILYCTNECSDEANISEIIIGEGSYIGEMSNIRASGGTIKIGKKCLIAQQVNIIGSNHSIEVDRFIIDQPWDLRKTGVNIGDDVWIGCGVTVLPGVTIGNGAIIAAGAVVVSDVMPFTIIGGVPAKFLKNRL